MTDFWARVDTSAGPEACWPWLGSRTRYGYGRFALSHHPQRTTSAHRIAYVETRGPVPEGLILDHLCRNRACCNPAHLEPVTNRENILRGIGPSAVNAQKETCPEGHPLDGLAPVRGERYCRTCRTAFNRADYQRAIEARRAYGRAYQKQKRDRKRAVRLGVALLEADTEGLPYPAGPPEHWSEDANDRD